MPIWPHAHMATGIREIGGTSNGFLLDSQLRHSLKDTPENGGGFAKAGTLKKKTHPKTTPNKGWYRASQEIGMNRRFQVAEKTKFAVDKGFSTLTCIGPSAEIALGTELAMAQRSGTKMAPW